LAHLDRPQDKAEGSAEDFIQWAGRYLLPHLPEGIPAQEIYSTRCAILHSLGVESRWTRVGRVRKVGFTVGGGPPIAYNPKIDPTMVIINLELLVEAFFAGVDKYIVEAFADSKRRPIVEKRLQHMLTSIPYRRERAADDSEEK